MTETTGPRNPTERARTYGSFVRFEHTLFSLPLILAGVFSAPGPALTGTRWLLIAIAAVGARSAAMALNRIIDRRLDALNPRTRSRALPAGRMRPAEAWGLLIASSVVYVGCCAALGPWYLKMAVVPLVVFTVYPYLKRFTPLCHFGVGVALGMAPLAGYAAAHPDLGEPGVALWLAGFAIAWVSGFDIIYATLDEDFDRLHRVRSMVAWLGRPRALRVSAVLHAVAFGCLVVVAWFMVSRRMTTPYWALAAVIATLTASAVLLWLEQRWAENVDLAFFHVNVFVGMAVLALVLSARA